jgi:two-component system, OmpR family, sensor histidine kinase VicK
MNEDECLALVRNLMSLSGRVIFSYDPQKDCFTYLSDGFENIWELPKEELTHENSNILNKVHPDDKEFLIKEYNLLSNSGAHLNIEFRIILPNDSVKWLLTTAQRTSNSQKFTAKKDAILEILSHDLAGPLANIQVLADLLADQLKDSSNPEVKNTVKIIYESSVKGIKLIRDFIDNEFLESTSPGLIKIRHNLVDKLKEIEEELVDAENIINKKVSFLYPKACVYVYFDQGKFMQVINNLISNAIKFTPDGGNIILELSEQDETVLLKVIDDGIGIPEKYHSVLFEKFTKARREGLKGEPTTGLGMSIIKTIIEWHSGKIWFESKENEGTTFYIELPKK